MSRLNHFNVVRFYGVSRDVGSRFSVDGSLYLVTEYASSTFPPVCICHTSARYMPRGSLWEVLRSRESALSDGMRHQMALDIARGMSYLHSLQPPILHRDLKALNLLVDKSFNVKVADFGIARPRVDDTMTFCGTPKWTAPEVLRMNNYSEKADVFSFGVVCVSCGHALVMAFVTLAQAVGDDDGGGAVPRYAADAGAAPPLTSCPCCC